MKNLVFAATVAVMVGFVGACAPAVPPTTTVTESSTTQPAVTTTHTTATTSCPAGTQLQSDGMCRWRVAASQAPPTPVACSWYWRPPDGATSFRSGWGRRTDQRRSPNALAVLARERHQPSA